MIGQRSLHESCRMDRRIVLMKLICSLGHCECDGHTVHKLSERLLTADWLAPRESVHGCTVRSRLSCCQVTSRPCDRFSRYSKWQDTFRAALVYRWFIYRIGARGSAVGWGTALKVGRSRVRFPMVSLEFSIDIILPGVDSGIFPGGNGGRCVRLTTLPPSCADCLEILEPQLPGTLRACPGL